MAGQGKGPGPVVNPPGQAKGPKADRFLLIGDVAVNFTTVMFVRGILAGDITLTFVGGTEMVFTAEDADLLRKYLGVHATKPEDDTEQP